MCSPNNAKESSEKNTTVLENAGINFQGNIKGAGRRSFYESHT